MTAQATQTNIPKLRFPEFTDSYTSVKLSSVCTKMQSGLSRLLKDEDVGLPVLRSNNIVNGQINTDDIKYWYNEDPQGANTRNYYLKGGDLLVNFINSIAQIGKVALYKKPLNRDAIITTNLMRLQFSKECNSNYLFYLFHTSSYLAHINSITKPAVNQASFTTKDFGKFLMPLPSLNEQQKIASFLGAVDDKIAGLQKKKDYLEAYKKGMMQRLFSQSLRFTDDNGNPFPDWEEKKLGDLGTITGGGTPDTTKSSYWAGDINWFTPTELKQKYVSNSQRTISESGLKNSSAKILPVGTVLLSSRATVGDVSIAIQECTTNQGFQSLITNNKNHNEFCYYLLLTQKKQIIRKSSGSTFLEISKKEIEKIMVTVPHIEEQKKIADFLSAIDDKIALVASELSHAQTFKKGLLQQMFV